MHLQDVATVVGVVVAAGAALVAVASLRSQAKTQQLGAVITTNDLWRDVATATATSVKISRATVTAIRNAYEQLTGVTDASVLATNYPATDFVAPAPYVVGAFFPRGTQDRALAPLREADYLQSLRARTLAFGYLRCVLQATDRPPWLSERAAAAAKKDLAAMDRAMRAWVNQMNEVAELYETGLADRRKFVGKRSVSIIQQLMAAEPYILWRNSTTPGRWGQRVVGLGTEARRYHWRSPLQRAALAQSSDPPGYQSAGTYPGFSRAIGWIIGPGDTPDGAIARRWAEVRITIGLGAGFSARSKNRQNQFVANLPRNQNSGLESATIDWEHVAAQPQIVRDAIAELRLG